MECLLFFAARSSTNITEGGGDAEEVHQMDTLASTPEAEKKDAVLVSGMGACTPVDTQLQANLSQFCTHALFNGSEGFVKWLVVLDRPGVEWCQLLMQKLCLSAVIECTYS